MKKNDPRHEARKLAMGSIFCWLFAETDEEACMNLTKDLLELDASNTDLTQTSNIIKGIKEHLDEIDNIIKECAPEWPLDKISKIDLVILRISIYEIVYGKSVPHKVAVNEAVELAKEFGNDTSSKFVNGVLGSVLENLDKEKQNG